MKNKKVLYNGIMPFQLVCENIENICVEYKKMLEDACLGATNDFLVKHNGGYTTDLLVKLYKSIVVLNSEGTGATVYGTNDFFENFMSGVKSKLQLLFCADCVIGGRKILKNRYGSITE